MSVLKSALAIAGLVMLTACASTASQSPSPAPASYEMPHVKRPNLLVADMERSLKIYRDILGFSPSNISDSSTDSFSYPVFNIPKEARMRYTYLGETGESRVFGLTEVRNIVLPKPASEPYMNAMVIGISDLPGKFEQLKAMGLKVTDSKIAGGAEFRFIEQAFVDPDGHLIVCYEVLP